MPLKISISGVRGTIPDSLTPEVCLDFAKAFGTYLMENSQAVPSKKVIIGTDSRASSEFIKGIIFSGLLSTGCDVVDLGICPTPTVGIMVRHLEACGGIVITASHNPLPWNGLKFMRHDGIFLNEKQAEQLIGIYNLKNFHKGRQGRLSHNASALNFHVQQILKVIHPAAIRRCKFRVGVDACNGAGAEISLLLLKKLGCRLQFINCNTSLPFPRPPEPTPENLAELCMLVKADKLDIGVAFDSDADRLAIVTNEGLPAGEELTLALAIKLILSQKHNQPKNKKIIITNLSTTKAIDDITKEYNGTLIRTKIGEVHVSEELQALDGLIGGEGNGGVIYPAVGFNRDALAGVALMLEMMAKTRCSIADLIREIPAYHTIKKKIACHNQGEALDFIEKIKTKFKGKNIILTEGVKVVMPQGWVHVRASNTEPVIRIIAESSDPQEAESLIKQVV